VNKASGQHERTANDSAGMGRTADQPPGKAPAKKAQKISGFVELLLRISINAYIR
jgi:hypothetical protein